MIPESQLTRLAIFDAITLTGPAPRKKKKATTTTTTAPPNRPKKSPLQEKPKKRARKFFNNLHDTLLLRDTSTKILPKIHIHHSRTRNPENQFN